MFFILFLDAVKTVAGPYKSFNTKMKKNRLSKVKCKEIYISDDDGVAQEEGVFLVTIIAALRVLQIGEAEVHVEDHPFLDHSVVLGADDEGALAELDARDEAQRFRDLIQQGGLLLLDVGLGDVVHVAQFRPFHQGLENLVLHGQEKVVRFLHLFRWVDEESPADVGAVRLVPGTQEANDGSEMKCLVITIEDIKSSLEQDDFHQFGYLTALNLRL